MFTPNLNTIDNYREYKKVLRSFRHFVSVQEPLDLVSNGVIDNLLRQSQNSFLVSHWLNSKRCYRFGTSLCLQDGLLVVPRFLEPIVAKSAFQINFRASYYIYWLLKRSGFADVQTMPFVTQSAMFWRLMMCVCIVDVRVFYIWTGSVWVSKWVP